MRKAVLGLAARLESQLRNVFLGRRDGPRTQLKQADEQQGCACGLGSLASGNGWSLYGLLASLRAQGKSVEASVMDKRFGEAWRLADVTLLTTSLPE